MNGTWLTAHYVCFGYLYDSELPAGGLLQYLLLLTNYYYCYYYHYYHQQRHDLPATGESGSRMSDFAAPRSVDIERPSSTGAAVRVIGGGEGKGG